MTLPGRRLKKYHPRRSRYLVREQKQKLKEMESKLSINISSLISSIKNGSTDQAQKVTLETKNNLVSIKQKMLELSQAMKGSFPKVVQEYLAAIETLASAAPGWVDEEKIRKYQLLTEKLEKLIAA